ncbi:MAG: autorepressor SdpR family transcription factor [Treponema sp.]
MQSIFKALADPVRREILEYLKNSSMTAGEICKKFSLSDATVSYHLSILKKAGLIRETKYKNFIYYELNTSVFEELIVWIKSFGGNTHGK